MAGKCTVCEKDIVNTTYVPMDEWKIKGNLCSKCYSQKIEEHYPGKHIRTNRLEDFECYHRNYCSLLYLWRLKQFQASESSFTSSSVRNCISVTTFFFLK